MLKGSAEKMVDTLIARYAETHRAYHTWEHIVECIKEAEALYGKDVWVTKPELMMAILFHDVVYDPHSHTNEKDSRKTMEEMLSTSGAPQKFIVRVGELIMVTTHKNIAVVDDEALIVDIDLSVLGKPWERFYHYEVQIRQEYHFVPCHEFVKGRVNILKGFLSRDRIYTTDYFHTKYERVARRNLSNSINILENKTGAVHP